MKLVKKMVELVQMPIQKYRVFFAKTYTEDQEHYRIDDLSNSDLKALVKVYRQSRHDGIPAIVLVMETISYDDNKEMCKISSKHRYAHYDRKWYWTFVI